LNWDEEYRPVWQCPSGAHNPLIDSSRNWLEQCPVCQKEHAPRRWQVEHLLGLTRVVSSSPWVSGATSTGSQAGICELVRMGLPGVYVVEATDGGQ
jgi:hypothetical protein